MIARSAIVRSCRQYPGSCVRDDEYGNRTIFDYESEGLTCIAEKKKSNHKIVEIEIEECVIQLVNLDEEIRTPINVVFIIAWVRSVTMQPDSRAQRSKSEDPIPHSHQSSSPGASKDYVASFQAMNERAVEDMTLNFFYRPHTISLLIICTAAAMYFAFTRYETSVEFHRSMVSIA